MKLPDRWKYIKLSDIGNISKGSGIKREDSNSGTIPAVRYGELYTSHNDYIKEFYSFISEKVAEESVLLKKGDLLFTCSGETKEDIGKCAAFVSDCKAYAGGDLIIFSPKVPCDSKFLGFLCNSYSINKQRYRYAQGDSVVHISTESIANLRITFPPLAEQQKIAEILCKQDKIISFKQKLLEQKQQQKKWLMQKLLEISHTNADCEEKISLGGVVIDKSGWKKEILGCICTITGRIGFRGYTRSDITSSDKGVLSLSPSNIIDGQLNMEDSTFITLEKYLESPEIMIQKHDIVFVKTGSTFGKVGYLDSIYQKATINPQLVIVRSNNLVRQNLLYYILKSDYFQNFVNKIVVGGAVPTLSQEQLSKIMIHLPTLPEQEIIAQVLSAADKEIVLLKSIIEQEKQKKKSLAQLLLTGTVRVKI